MSLGCLSIYLNNLSFFQCCLIVFNVQVLTLIVKFILKYFISLDVVGNEIAFLILLLDCSLPVYKNLIDICMLILGSATLINLFIRSGFFRRFLY